MEVAVYNIKGEDTGRKVTLNDSVFAIEPNEHVLYLAVKQYLANQRQGTHKSKERFREVLASFTSKKVEAAHVSVTSILRCCVVEAVCSVRVLAIIVSSLIRK